MTAQTPGRGVSGLKRLQTPLEGHPGPAELDLDAIRARADAATPGPWWAWDRGTFVGFEIAVGAPAEDGRPVDRLPDAMRTDIGRREDAEFIAAARTDVPALLDEIERLRTWRGLTRAVVEAAQAWRRFRNFEYRPGEINFHLITAHHEDLDLARAIDDLVAGLEITTTEPLDTKEAAT